MRSTHIRCQGCPFEGVLAHRGITLRYHLSNGEIVTGYRDTGWCYRCDCIRDIERPFDPDAITDKIQEASSEKGGGLFSTLFGIGKRERERAHETLQTLEAELQLATHRKSPPRCLTCGSDRTVPLAFGSNGISTSFIHECGKRLYTLPPDENAIRISRRPLELDLDAEGNILSSSDS